MYDPSLIRTRDPVANAAFDFMVDQNGFLHDKLFDVKQFVSNNAQQGDTMKIAQFDVSKLRVPNTLAKTDAKAPLIDEQVFYRNIDLEEHKLGKKINPYELANSDNPALIDDTRATKILTLGILLKREQDAADLATTVANYPSDLTSALAAGDRWTDPDGDPEADAITAHNALVLRCGRKGNAVAMSGTTWRKLKTNPNFRDRVKYTSSGPVTVEAAKAFFDVDHFFITDNVKETANEGAASSIAGFWGANVIFFVYNPSLSMDMVGYGALWVQQNGFWTAAYELKDRNGPNGAMRVLEIGSVHAFGKGMVISAADSDFAAGYLFRTTVD